MVDPQFKASKNAKDHRAHMDLLFTVETQVLEEVDGGYKGERAWRIERRTPAAARRARARIEAAGAESDESGVEDDHDYD